LAGQRQADRGDEALAQRSMCHVPTLPLGSPPRPCESASAAAVPAATPATAIQNQPRRSTLGDDPAMGAAAGGASVTVLSVPSATVTRRASATPSPQRACTR